MSRWQAPRQPGTADAATSLHAVGPGDLVGQMRQIQAEAMNARLVTP